MPASATSGFCMMALTAVLVSACGSAKTAGGLSAAGGSLQLGPAQRQIVEKGVRQIIHDSGAAKIKTMKAAAAKAPGHANVCGYVSYAAAGGGGSVEQQYFIELGPEAGVETALRGQVASNPAKRAKVEFICRRAGLD